MDQLLIATRYLYEAMYRFDSAAAGALGIHVSDLRCINALEAGPLSPGDIGRRLSLTSGSVTSMIDRLEAQGFILRTRDDSDHRRFKITLKPTFRRHANRVYSRLGRAIAKQLEGSQPPEIAAAAECIKVVAQGFDAAGRAQSELAAQRRSAPR